MVECGSCELAAARDAGVAPLWDRMVRTAGWDVVHNNGTDLAGWLVLVLRRHLTSMADLTDEEAAEFGPLVRAASRAVQEVVGCPRTYLVQFSDHPRHRHVHVHVIPRHADLPDDAHGPGIFRRHLGIPADRLVPEAERDRIAAVVRERVLPGFPGAG